MDTHVHTPMTVFGLPQRLVVPLFQRAYVWDEEGQWEPLWQDVRRLADHQLVQPSRSATHFLGAVVIQASDATPGLVPIWSIVDGQQRVTTLQILFDAVSAAFEARELDELSGQLNYLTHNQPIHVATDDVALKLRHSSHDRAAFDEVMLAAPPIAYDELNCKATLLARCHRFFAERVDEWLSEDPDSEEIRSRALAGVLTQGLQLVVIDLKADENSQEIFETLNARGTPLTAADLIKNFVFQRLGAEQVDTEQAYRELWPFERPFWEEEVSVGRNLMTRSSLFLNQWLISRIGEEIGPKSTFARFKHHVEHVAGTSMLDLLVLIKDQADRYEQWIDASSEPHSDLGAVEMNVYRTTAVGTEAMKPVLLWLTEPDAGYSSTTVSQVVATVESWLIRRMMLRLSMSDLGRVVADLIRSNRGLSGDELAGRVEAYLGRQNAASTYWPGDAQIRDALLTVNAYRWFRPRARLRLMLEAVEDEMRGYTRSAPSRTGVRVQRGRLPIEHLLPQRWPTHWPVTGLAAEVNRDAHVHRLGNLTLITSSLNAAVSNGPWTGTNGKRAQLARHDVMLMNRQIRDMSADGWDETRIDERTETMIAALLATWPVPDGHVGLVFDRVATDHSSVTVKDLVAAGLLPAGTVLRPRPGPWDSTPGVVLPNGDLDVGGKTYASPSGAAYVVRRVASNGWLFWQLPDGRRLNDLRHELIEARTDQS